MFVKSEETSVKAKLWKGSQKISATKSIWLISIGFAVYLVLGLKDDQADWINQGTASLNGKHIRTVCSGAALPSWSPR